MKIAVYLFYYLIAKHMPRSYEFGLMGKIGKKLRSAAVQILAAQAHPTVFVERGADFGSGKKLYLKEYACVGENARITGSGRVTIGRHAMMGPDVMIITSDHVLKKEGFGKDYITRDIEIGDYAWIGARAIILKGVKLGKHSVVGAGAVVTKDVPDYAVVGGSPARILKYRDGKTKDEEQSCCSRAL